MSETVTMAEVLYVAVDDEGEPYRWAPEGEGVRRAASYPQRKY